jgi:hypothetical protein
MISALTGIHSKIQYHVARVEQGAHSPFPLPKAVQIQLNYDTTRLNIISHLYGVTGASGRVLDAVWPFVDAAISVPYEPYYLDCIPDPHGHCPWCNIR